MKQLILVWSRVRQYARTNPGAFFFYLCSSVVCSLILIYVYGNTIPALKIIKGDASFYRSYSIDLHETNNFDINRVKEMEENWPFLDDLKTPSILLQKKWAKEDFPDVNFDGYPYVIPMIEAEYHNQLHLFAVQGEVQFNNTDLAAAEPPVIVPGVLQLKNFSNKIFHIGDRQYRLIGRHTGVFSVIIPIRNFLKQIEEPDFVVIRLENVVTNTKIRDEVTVYLQSYFPENFIQPPFNNGLDPAQTNIVAAILAILYGLALSSLTFISKYLFEQNRSVNGIYRLTGSSRRQLARIALLESVFLAATTLVIAFGFHRLFYTSVFAHLNLSPDIVYTTTDYIRLTLIIIGVTALLYRLNQRDLTRSTAAVSRF
ncbi:hypothetical protein QWJ34_11415 [Saccharibacillus sp. CPCC 101409]|uniref:ABC transporter permease n=1 Tax=Saccharibacillus sp. CPCC 101409 TaxID=3058041 RepID=UPI0026739277|nr:FtsX-like permease family protein [Saccharibacillus sp. CPCC 101409]MDO3410372.1 hypothetical protein [Saccharibacillus sp. CPCC 101409]